MRTWRIPGALPGILFFVAWTVSAAAGELALDLFAEGDWLGCRRECGRTLSQAPENESARLLSAVCGFRLTNGVDPAVDVLGGLAASATSANVRAMAAYELGRCFWSRGDSGNAFRLFRQAFLETSSEDLFLRAGCSLDLLTREFPTPSRRASLEKNDRPLFQFLDTSRVLWTPELIRECRLHKKPDSALSKPGKWVVAFYREMVRPAIGGRCSLEPSCSEYFKQASEKHGLLGLPIQADRFVREPSVVQAAERPVSVKEGIRYDDPLSDHDFWMRK